MSLLDQQRERIQDDLRGLVAGEVRCDDVALQLFASDASIYEVRPLGVVRPRSTADVSACVRYAAEKRIPIHARGAGTGVAGESLGPGLVIDFSAHLRRVIRTDAERVRVQSGIPLERLNEQLRPAGRLFGPDPANGAVTTIGGMIGVDASGSRWLKCGSTRRHVEGLQAVLADGQVLELGREPLVDGQSTSGIPRKRELVSRLAELMARNAELIRQQQPKGPHGHCGYNLAGVLGEGFLDVGRLLVGSEGTLALVTEATLATQTLPRHRGVALLLFDSVEKAARAVPDILAHGPTACELMDRRHVSLAREAEPRFERLVPPETETVLLVELDGDDPLQLRERVHRLVAELWQQKRVAFGAREAFEDEETELFWRLVAKVQPALYRLPGPRRPIPIVEDMAVAPEALPDFLVRAQNALKRNQATASLFCHAGQGQVHLQPFLDLDDPEDVRRMRQLAEDLYQEVLALGGSIGGEHACGLSRTAFVRRQAGPLYEALVEIKRIFDPANLLNPGKIVGDDSGLMVRYLRPEIPLAGPPALPLGGAEIFACQLADKNVCPTGISRPGAPVGAAADDRSRTSPELPIGGGPPPIAPPPAPLASAAPAAPLPAPPAMGQGATASLQSGPSPGGAAGVTLFEPIADDTSPKLRELVELQLNWDPSRVRDAVAACNRCGECRTQAPEFRMCPLFRPAPSEEASPRAKANLIRGVLSGGLGLPVLTSAEFKAVADLCIHCHSCRLECPAGVDIALLMREGKGAFVAANGLTMAEWAMTRLDLLGAIGGLVAPVTNWALSNRQARWLLEKTLGIAQGRRLPRVAMHSFLRRAAHRRLTRPSRRSGQQVLYFVDVYANYFDPQLGEALVAVMEHNGISVFVHPEQKQAGMASIACGALDRARQLAKHNVAILADSIRQGYHVVATEPAAALCLKHEYPQLLDDDDARLVADHSSEAGSFLWRMHTLGQLQLDLRPLNLSLGYHTPCHLRALGVGSPGENLLGLIPGLRLHHIESGCSGMAGTYGLLHRNYRGSLRAGRKLIGRLRDTDLQAGVTECSTCKVQMEQGTTKPTLHPIKLLALSYGRMPEIAGLLTPR